MWLMTQVFEFELSTKAVHYTYTLVIARLSKQTLLARPSSLLTLMNQDGSPAWRFWSRGRPCHGTIWHGAVALPGVFPRFASPSLACFHVTCALSRM